jgi:Glycosyltransferase family 25 (LPS biosynthesis protein)
MPPVSDGPTLPIGQPSTAFGDHFGAAFCINLAARTDRWEVAQQTFQAAGLRIRRFEAIDTRGSSVRLCPSPSEAAGAVGCLRSHAGIYRIVLEEKLKAALVFEDDVTLADHFLERLLPWVEGLGQPGAPDGWDLLVLGRLPNGLGAHAYAITPRICEMMLESLRPENQHLDVVLLRETAPRVRTHKCALAWQRGLPSDTAPRGRFVHGDGAESPRPRRRH